MGNSFEHSHPLIIKVSCDYTTRPSEISLTCVPDRVPSVCFIFVSFMQYAVQVAKNGPKCSFQPDKELSQQNNKKVLADPYFWGVTHKTKASTLDCSLIL